MIMKLILGAVIIAVISLVLISFKKEDPKDGERYAGRFG